MKNYRLACESPRWYLQKGKFEMAKKTVQRIRAINKCEVDDKAIEEVNMMVDLEAEVSLPQFL